MHVHLGGHGCARSGGTGCQPPTLAIISLTPRAFTFPIDKSEAYLRQLALTPSQPTLVRTLSPLPPSSSTSQGSTLVFSSTSSFTTLSSGPSSPSSHKRRKSSICSDIERRPRKGDKDYIKRPENTFILFRRKCCEERQQAQEEAVSAAYADVPTKKRRQVDLSKTISQQWKALSAEERLYWEEQAKEKKEHEQMYPNYVYRPQRSKDKKGKKSKRGEFEHETDCESSISFVLPLSPPTVMKHGRSASAPTPPPARQTIQVPTVYMPSCPTSPSLLPMISRRASHPDHGMNSSASQFDFLPQQQFSHPNAYMSGVDFEFGLTTAPKANGFYHGMFENPSAPHPLSISTDMSMLQASQQMVSPVSSIASASSGPHSGPYTPINCMPSAFSYHEDLASCMNDGELDSPMSGSPLDNVHFGYPEYSWEGQGAWESHSDLLAGDEFDLSAIPPIQLGMPGCGGELASMSQHPSTFNIDFLPGSFDGSSMEVHQYSLEAQGHDTFEQLFNFENMLVAPAGF
ncbi:uncharacterized protein F5891DRAFT_1131249 [Suillus fuscotomentosus]|uniref:HMG box domain-containing protein n=1 Tax=Suillus fuscotomentosus TaxID=1912939 RepID=A0AAD4DUP0_9AGAM|nr:uncharacterized protein F5891DRAFT_1131249 [Suillus fuscotomentosus]KAG1893494.1 hypothetical protein F5891DRAFT_1131249 [Suillus fuscotomentosus]